MEAITERMNPLDIIAEYYDPNSKAFEILIRHGMQEKWSEYIGFQPDKIST